MLRVDIKMQRIRQLQREVDERVEEIKMLSEEIQREADKALAEIGMPPYYLVAPKEAGRNHKGED